MSHEILQEQLENRSGSEAFKPSEVLHLARRRMLRESESSGTEDIVRRFPFRFQGVYCGYDVRLLIRSRKVKDSRDLFLTTDGSPHFPQAHIVVSGPDNSALYTYSENRLYVSDSTKQFYIKDQEHAEFGNHIEVTGPMVQVFNYMMLDVERP